MPPDYIDNTPAPTEAPLLLTERQTADLLSLSPKTVWSLAKTGKLPSIKIGSAKRYDRRDVFAFIDSAKTARE